MRADSGGVVGAVADDHVSEEGTAGPLPGATGPAGRIRRMTDYTKVNLRDVEDLAPKFGFSPGLESRFARGALGLQQSGMSYFRIAPDFRTPFGHRHERQEEVYVVLSGSARIRLDDEVLDLGPLDAVRVAPSTTRCLEGGPEGAEILAFGAPNTDGSDAEMAPGWWGD
jgi:quercetin dioxygenase-like cupin family protein